MRFVVTEEFEKNYKKLPVNVQKQTDKQLGFLLRDFRHPSLRAKKMGGFKEVFEARVSKGYRMRYKQEGEKIVLITVGPHDVGLGKN